MKEITITLVRGTTEKGFVWYAIKTKVVYESGKRFTDMQFINKFTFEKLKNFGLVEED